VAGTGDTEPADAHPPAPAARHAKREIGKCPDAGSAQRFRDPRLKPTVDGIADQRNRSHGPAQLFQGRGHGACGSSSLARRADELLRQVIAMPRPREARNVPANRADDAARRLAGVAPICQVPFDSVARGQSLVPGTQR